VSEKERLGGSPRLLAKRGRPSHHNSPIAAKPAINGSDSPLEPGPCSCGGVRVTGALSVTPAPAPPKASVWDARKGVKAASTGLGGVSAALSRGTSDGVDASTRNAIHTLPSDVGAGGVCVWDGVGDSDDCRRRGS
jgi:hypothetical protein